MTRTRGKVVRARRPKLEALESRAMMDGSQPPLGINLTGNFSDSTQAAFADILKQAEGWQPIAGGTAPLTADGYPSVPSSTYTLLSAYPAGTYKLSYQGTGTLVFSGAATLVPASITQSVNGTHYADVTVTHTGDQYLRMAIASTSATDPIHNMHLYAPGYATDGSQTFTTEFLKRLQPFVTIRTMDWTGTNNSTQVNWSDRVLPTGFQQTSQRGVAWETIIALANQTHKDLWVNVPDQATDDYITHLADLLRNTLHSDAHLYVEYSNELWSGGNSQYYRTLNTARVNLSNGLLDPTTYPNDDWSLEGEQQVYRLKQIGDMFRQEYAQAPGGNLSAQVRPILGGFLYYSDHLNDAFKFLNHRYNTPNTPGYVGAPGTYIYALAEATYATLNPADDNSSLTLDSLFASIANHIQNTEIPLIAQARAQAMSNSLHLLGYEGSQTLAYNNAGNSAVKAAAQLDPRMGQVLVQEYNAWAHGGGEEVEQFAFVGLYNANGGFGLLQSQAEPGEAKWDAIAHYLLPGGDSTLDGKVDGADLAVLTANYRAAGVRWWEQGDSNLDNKVDAADLNILRTNLGPVNAEVAAEAATFAPGVTGVVGQPITLDASGHTGTTSFIWNAQRGSVFAGFGRGAKFTFTPAVAGTYQVVLLTRDINGNKASASVSIAVGAAADPGTVDDASADAWTAGPGWTTGTVGYAAGDRRLPAGNLASTATWLATAPSGIAGTYQIQATWPANATLSPDATYQIFDGDSLVGTAAVNQRLAPVGNAHNNVVFQSLGNYTSSTGTLRIVLLGAADGAVAADAIRVISPPAPAGSKFRSGFGGGGNAPLQALAPPNTPPTSPAPPKGRNQPKSPPLGVPMA